MDELLSQPSGKKVRAKAPERKNPVIHENWFFQGNAEFSVPPYLRRMAVDSASGPVSCFYEGSPGMSRVLFSDVSFWKGEVPSSAKVLRFHCDGPFSVTNLQPDRQETPDQTPIEVGVPASRPLTIDEELKRFLHAHREDLAQQGAESLEEAYDFDVEDDMPEPWSPHELEEVEWQSLEPDQELPPPTSEVSSEDPSPAPESSPEGGTQEQAEDRPPAPRSSLSSNEPEGS